MPAQTQAPQAVDPQAIAAEIARLQAEADARLAALHEALAAAQHEGVQTDRAVALLHQEREDVRQAREAAQDRARQEEEAAARQEAHAQAQARYRQALVEVEAQLGPLPGLIAEALASAEALWPYEQAGGIRPSRELAPERLGDRLRALAFAGGLRGRGGFPPPATLTYGGPLA